MVIVLGVVTILSFVLVTVLRRTASAQARISHVAAWQESITAAEAGADYAVAALRSSLTDSSNAFAGWSITDGQGLLLPNQGRRYVLSTLVRKGEGDTRLDAEVVMDRPAELLDGDMQWYRIRSMGTTYLPGVTYSSSDRRDHALRRLSFFLESTESSCR